MYWGGGDAYSYSSFAGTYQYLSLSKPSTILLVMVMDSLTMFKAMKAHPVVAVPGLPRTLRVLHDNHLREESK